MAGRRVGSASKETFNESPEVLRGVDEITKSIVGEIASSIVTEGRHEDIDENQRKLDQLITLVKDLSHRLEYVEKNQHDLVVAKFDSLEKEHHMMNASLKLLEYVVYSKDLESPDKGNGNLGKDKVNNILPAQYKDKGKAIATEGFPKQGSLIQEISATEELRGDEYNPDVTFPLSEDENVIIDETLSTPKPQKMPLNMQQKIENLNLGSIKKDLEVDDLFGSNMMGMNEDSLPPYETPTQGGSSNKKRGRPPGSTSAKSKSARGRGKANPYRTPSLASLDKPKGHTFPPGVRGTFKPKPEYDLTWAEMRMAYYVFNKQMDPREMLVKIGDVSAKRRDFECLTPNNFIDEKIITLTCRKMTWIQAGAATITNWILPPGFAIEALNDKPLKEIIEHYKKPWMPFAYPLKVIYVPLVEDDILWYLMVIDFYTKKVYKMDVFAEPHALGRRHDAMKQVCKVLEQVISTHEYQEEMWKTPLDFSSWEFKEVQGLPNLGTCKNSGCWLLDWLEMGDAFQTNIIGVLEEEKTRMQSAIKLVLGHYNELRATIEANMRNTWIKLPL